MAKVVIEYEKIISAVGAQLQLVWQELANSEVEGVSALMSSIKSIEVSDEHFFRKQENDRKLRRGTVYMVVRFGSGPSNYASSVAPVSIYALGTANQVKPVQMLLGAFASSWTTLNLMQGTEGEISDMLQVWNTPEVISNFNIVDEDFRNLYKVSGSIVVGQAAIRVGTLTYFYEEDGEEKSETVNIMSFRDNQHASLDTQPFGDIHGFVESEVNFSTYSFSVSTYLLNGQLGRDILALRGFRYRPKNGQGERVYNSATSKFGPNDKMKLEIAFTNDYTNLAMPGESAEDDEIAGDSFFSKFKVVDSAIGQVLGQIPTLDITFTR